MHKLWHWYIVVVLQIFSTVNYCCYPKKYFEPLLQICLRYCVGYPLGKIFHGYCVGYPLGQGKVNWQVQVWRASLTDLTNLSSKTFFPPPTVWQASYTYYSATFILLLQVSSEVQLGNQFKLAGKVPCWLKSRSRPRFDDLTMPIAGWMIHK